MSNDRTEEVTPLILARLRLAHVCVCLPFKLFLLISFTEQLACWQGEVWPRKARSIIRGPHADPMAGFPLASNQPQKGYRQTSAQDLVSPPNIHYIYMNVSMYYGSVVIKLPLLKQSPQQTRISAYRPIRGQEKSRKRLRPCRQVGWIRTPTVFGFRPDGASTRLAPWPVRSAVAGEAFVGKALLRLDAFGRQQRRQLLRLAMSSGLFQARGWTQKDLPWGVSFSGERATSPG